MMHVDLHGQTVTDEELAVVAAAALAAAGEQDTAPLLSTLDDASAAAILAVLASVGVPFQRPEPPQPSVNMTWKRSQYEQSVRPRWR
jgi:hypothetical protein